MKNIQVSFTSSSVWPNCLPRCTKCSTRINPSSSSSHMSNTSFSLLTNSTRCSGREEEIPSIAYDHQQRSKIAITRTPERAGVVLPSSPSYCWLHHHHHPRHQHQHHHMIGGKVMVVTTTHRDSAHFLFASLR